MRSFCVVLSRARIVTISRVGDCGAVAGSAIRAQRACQLATDRRLLGALVRQARTGGRAARVPLWSRRTGPAARRALPRRALRERLRAREFCGLLGSLLGRILKDPVASTFPPATALWEDSYWSWHWQITGFQPITAQRAARCSKLEGAARYEKHSSSRIRAVRIVVPQPDDRQRLQTRERSPVEPRGRPRTSGGTAAGRERRAGAPRQTTSERLWPTGDRRAKPETGETRANHGLERNARGGEGARDGRRRAGARRGARGARAQEARSVWRAAPKRRGRREDGPTDAADDDARRPTPRAKPVLPARRAALRANNPKSTNMALNAFAGNRASAGRAGAGPSRCMFFARRAARAWSRTPRRNSSAAIRARGPNASSKLFGGDPSARGLFEGRRRGGRVAAAPRRRRESRSDASRS